MFQRQEWFVVGQTHGHFLTHVVVTKDVAFFIFSNFKGCWAGLWQVQCRMVKEASCAVTASLLFRNLKSCKWYLEGFCTSELKNDPELGVPPHIPPQRPALCFWCWEIVPSPVHQKPGEVLQLIVMFQGFHIRVILCWLLLLL